MIPDEREGGPTRREIRLQRIASVAQKLASNRVAVSKMSKPSEIIDFLSARHARSCVRKAIATMRREWQNGLKGSGHNRAQRRLISRRLKFSYQGR